MELIDVLNGRRSIRKYTDDSVPMDTVLALLDAARHAPSWKNLQCSRYIVVNDRPTIQKLGEILDGNPNPDLFDVIPYMVVLCANPEKSEVFNDMDYAIADAAISLDHFTLAAHDKGLGTCWLGVFPEEEVKKCLSIPDPMRVVALTPLGVPAQSPKQRPRIDLEELYFVNRWGTQ